ncbi:MAG: hypothetical protein ACUVXF_07405 [Desulfobaccales bacterium]
MRFKALQELARPAALEIVLGSLPERVFITDYAKAKAFAVSDLVRQVHGEAFEWYGFTLAAQEQPEVIVEVGLPENAENQETYTSLSPEGIAAFQETLAAGLVINGWLHSHGAMDFRRFSEVDEVNQATVLDYVTSRLKIPLAKKEVVIRDLNFMVLGEEISASSGMEAHGERAARLEQGSVTLLTDVPVQRARLLETVYGGFCYAIVIGDKGWTSQEIHYKTRGVLTGDTVVSKREADLAVVPVAKNLTSGELEILEAEVRNKIKPSNRPLEKLERG